MTQKKNHRVIFSYNSKGVLCCTEQMLMADGTINIFGGTLLPEVKEVLEQV